MTSGHYKKSWLAVSSIARDLINQDIGDRTCTVKEYTERLNASRGIVQNAFQLLQDEGAVAIEKKGKIGSFIAALDILKLFELAEIKFITGSMPTPLQRHLAGLATGICHSLKICPVPFTFAFVQGANNRIAALNRMTYDFIVTSKATALYQIAGNPDLEIAMELEGSIYSPPYAIFSNNPDFPEVRNGIRIAVDPTATDQWVITNLLCQGKDVVLINLPYTSTRNALLSGSVDLIVYRAEEWSKRCDYVYQYPLDLIDMADYLRAVVLVNKNNYGMGGILSHYLFPDLIAQKQHAVINRDMEPQFY